MTGYKFGWFLFKEILPFTEENQKDEHTVGVMRLICQGEEARKR
jgi:hypothetical protein